MYIYTNLVGCFYFFPTPISPNILAPHVQSSSAAAPSQIAIILFIPAAAGSLSRPQRWQHRRSCDWNKSNSVVFAGRTEDGWRVKGKKLREKVLSAISLVLFLFALFLYVALNPRRHLGRPIVSREKYEKHSRTNIHIFVPQFVCVCVYA